MRCRVTERAVLQHSGAVEMKQLARVRQGAARFSSKGHSAAETKQVRNRFARSLLVDKVDKKSQFGKIWESRAILRYSMRISFGKPIIEG